MGLGLGARPRQGPALEARNGPGKLGLGDIAGQAGQAGYRELELKARIDRKADGAVEVEKLPKGALDLLGVEGLEDPGAK